MLKWKLIFTLIVFLCGMGTVSAQAPEEKIPIIPDLCDSKYPSSVTEEECKDLSGQKVGLLCMDCGSACKVPNPKTEGFFKSQSLAELKTLNGTFLKMLPIKFKDWRYPDCTIYLLYLDEKIKNAQLEEIKKENYFASALSQGQARMEGTFPAGLAYFWELNNGIITIDRCRNSYSCCEINLLLSLDNKGNLLVDGEKFNGEISYRQP